MLEPPRSSAEAPYIALSCEHGDGVVRVGALCLNHPELVLKHPTHLARAVREWFM